MPSRQFADHSRSNQAASSGEGGDNVNNDSSSSNFDNSNPAPKDASSSESAGPGTGGPSPTNFNGSNFNRNNNFSFNSNNYGFKRQNLWPFPSGVDMRVLYTHQINKIHKTYKEGFIRMVGYSSMLLFNHCHHALEEIFFTERDKERWDDDEEEFYGKQYIILSLPQKHFDNPVGNNKKTKKNSESDHNDIGLPPQDLYSSDARGKAYYFFRPMGQNYRPKESDEKRTALNLEFALKRERIKIASQNGTLTGRAPILKIKQNSNLNGPGKNYNGNVNGVTGSGGNLNANNVNNIIRGNVNNNNGTNNNNNNRAQNNLNNSNSAADTASELRAEWDRLHQRTVLYPTSLNRSMSDSETQLNQYNNLNSSQSSLILNTVPLLNESGDNNLVSDFLFSGPDPTENATDFDASQYHNHHTNLNQQHRARSRDERRTLTSANNGVGIGRDSFNQARDFRMPQESSFAPAGNVGKNMESNTGNVAASGENNRFKDNLNDNNVKGPQVTVNSMSPNNCSDNNTNGSESMSIPATYHSDSVQDDDVHITMTMTNNQSHMEEGPPPSQVMDSAFCADNVEQFLNDSDWDDVEFCE